MVSILIQSSKHWNDFRLPTDFMNPNVVNWFAGGYGAATMGGVCCAPTAWNLGVCAHQCGRASGGRAQCDRVLRFQRKSHPWLRVRALIFSTYFLKHFVEAFNTLENLHFPRIAGNS